jgi:hypothetical protein
VAAFPCNSLLGGRGFIHRRPKTIAEVPLATPRAATDMEIAAVNSPAAAFVAGLVTSLHCAGMCGPLACALMPVRGTRATRRP